MWDLASPFGEGGLVSPQGRGVGGDRAADARALLAALKDVDVLAAWLMAVGSMPHRGG